MFCRQSRKRALCRLCAAAALPLRPVFAAALAFGAGAAQAQEVDFSVFSAFGQGAAGLHDKREIPQAFIKPAPPPPNPPPHLALLNLRMAETGQQARYALIAVFNEKPDYAPLILDNPPRLVLDLPAAQFRFSAAKARQSARISSLRYGANGEGRSRLIITLSAPFYLQALRAEPLESHNPHSPWQLAAELRAVSPAEFRQYLRLSRAGGGGLKASGAAFVQTEPQADTGCAFRVMIDPGHGGFDSGALSAGGVQEKQVVLAFAKILFRALQKQPGIAPFLTRDADIFLRLSARVEEARAKNADLFISVHADHIAAPELRGATVYTLSARASDDMAKVLAERQNLSDLADGLPADEPPAVTDILLDMRRRETHALSEEFAALAVRSLQSGGIELISNPLRSAGFQVLRAADIPSALIELGYLSSSADVKRLTDPRSREKMAQILASGIALYARGKHAKCGAAGGAQQQAGAVSGHSF